MTPTLIQPRKNLRPYQLFPDGSDSACGINSHCSMCDAGMRQERYRRDKQASGKGVGA